MRSLVRETRRAAGIVCVFSMMVGMGALRRPRPRSSGRNEYPSDTWHSKELRRCTRRGHRSAMSLPR